MCQPSSHLGVLEHETTGEFETEGCTHIWLQYHLTTCALFSILFFFHNKHFETLTDWMTVPNPICDCVIAICWMRRVCQCTRFLFAIDKARELPRVKTYETWGVWEQAPRKLLKIVLVLQKNPPPKKKKKKYALNRQCGVTLHRCAVALMVFHLQVLHQRDVRSSHHLTHICYTVHITSDPAHRSQSTLMPDWHTFKTSVFKKACPSSFTFCHK